MQTIKEVKLFRKLTTSRTWSRLRTTLSGVQDLLYSLINRGAVTAIIAIHLICSNVYRLFPVADKCVKCREPITGLIGDKVYYYGITIAWLLTIQLLRQKKFSDYDQILLSGFFSLAINELLDELFLNPTKVTFEEILLNAIIAFIVCRKLKIKFHWIILIIGIVVVLGNV